MNITAVFCVCLLTNSYVMIKYICVLYSEQRLKASQSLNIALSLGMFSSLYVGMFHYHWVTTGGICADYDFVLKILCMRENAKCKSNL